MKTKIPKNITPTKFAKWLRDNTWCDTKVKGQRLEAVVYAENIEHRRCVPLIAEMNEGVLEITEFINDYYYTRDALAAIKEEHDTYAPVPFYDWVQDQYLTDKNVKITKVEI